MKRLITLTIVFILYTIFVNSCPTVTHWDESFITWVQAYLKEVPLYLPLLPDCKLYSAMIVLPIVIASLIMFKKKVYWKIPFLASIPLIAFVVNIIVKNLVQRPRPELQLAIHPTSFSYVSSHSLVTFCLWGFLTYLVFKYFKNRTIKLFFVIFTLVWILFVGFSRIWIGVHNPTDVIGAYLLGGLLLSIFVQSYEYLNKRFKANEECSCYCES